jgi:hypothetical protein
MKTIFLTFFLLVSAQIVLAQPPGMPGAPDQAPIDGGLTVLAIGGAGLALKKLRSRK